MIRLLTLMLLVFSTMASAQTVQGEGAASYSVDGRTDLDSNNWARLQLNIDGEVSPDSSRTILLMGLTEVNEHSNRPEAGARPAYQEVLAEGPVRLPLEIERWLRRDLHWFVLSATSVPPGPDSWMSDSLELDAGSLSLELEGRGRQNPTLTTDSANTNSRMSLFGLLPLILLPLGLGWLFGRDNSADKSWGWPLLLQGLAAGIIFVIASDLWLVGYHLDNEFTSSDLLEYCDGVLTLQGGADVWPPSRSKLAGIIPALLGGWEGPIQALRRGAILGATLVGAGIFVWARLLGGRVAGWAAVCLALTLGPLTHLPRMLSFYPEITAALTWAAVASVWLVLRPSIKSALWAGIGLGLCCLIDARGLPYAALFGFGLFCWLLFSLRREALRPLVVMLIPLLISWPLGRLAYSSQVGSLEAQLDMSPLESVLQLSQGEDAVLPPIRGESSDRAPLVWGRTSLVDLPAALGGLANSWPDESPLEREGGLFTLETRVRPWLPLVMFTLPVAFWLVWIKIRSKGVVALGVSILPTVVAAPLVLMVLIPTSDAPSRFITMLLPPMAVCMGLAFEGFVRAAPSDGRINISPTARNATLGLVLLGIVSGWAPTSLAPDAGWRSPWRAVAEHDRIAQRVSEGDYLERGALGAECLRAIGD